MLLERYWVLCFWGNLLGFKHKNSASNVSALSGKDLLSEKSDEKEKWIYSKWANRKLVAEQISADSVQRNCLLGWPVLCSCHNGIKILVQLRIIVVSASDSNLNFIMINKCSRKKTFE